MVEWRKARSTTVLHNIYNLLGSAGCLLLDLGLYRMRETYKVSLLWPVRILLWLFMPNVNHLERYM